MLFFVKFTDVIRFKSTVATCIFTTGIALTTSSFIVPGCWWSLCIWLIHIVVLSYISSNWISWCIMINFLTFPFVWFLCIKIQIRSFFFHFFINDLTSWCTNLINFSDVVLTLINIMSIQIRFFFVSQRSISTQISLIISVFYIMSIQIIFFFVTQRSISTQISLTISIFRLRYNNNINLLFIFILYFRLVLQPNTILFFFIKRINILFSFVWLINCFKQSNIRIIVVIIFRNWS